MPRDADNTGALDQQKRASFFVRILFRQNGTLQGEVQWMEGQKTQHFRSAMELVTLMNEAAEHGGIIEGENNRRQWFAESTEERDTSEQSLQRLS